MNPDDHSTSRPANQAFGKRAAINGKIQRNPTVVSRFSTASIFRRSICAGRYPCRRTVCFASSLTSEVSLEPHASRPTTAANISPALAPKWSLGIIPAVARALYQPNEPDRKKIAQDKARDRISLECLKALSGRCGAGFHRFENLRGHIEANDGSHIAHRESITGQLFAAGIGCCNGDSGSGDRGGVQHQSIISSLSQTIRRSSRKIIRRDITPHRGFYDLLGLLLGHRVSGFLVGNCRPAMAHDAGRKCRKDKQGRPFHTFPLNRSRTFKASHEF